MIQLLPWLAQPSRTARFQRKSLGFLPVPSVVCWWRRRPASSKLSTYEDPVIPDPWETPVNARRISVLTPTAERASRARCGSPLPSKYVPVISPISPAYFRSAMALKSTTPVSRVRPMARWMTALRCIPTGRSVAVPSLRRVAANWQQDAARLAKACVVSPNPEPEHLALFGTACPEE